MRLHLTLKTNAATNGNGNMAMAIMAMKSLTYYIFYLKLKWPLWRQMIAGWQCWWWWMLVAVSIAISTANAVLLRV